MAKDNLSSRASEATRPISEHQIRAAQLTLTYRQAREDAQKEKLFSLRRANENGAIPHGIMWQAQQDLLEAIYLRQLAEIELESLEPQARREPA